MLIIADKRIPERAKERLRVIGELVEFETDGIVPDYISGHPDIFMFQGNTGLICAPNMPEVYYRLLSDRNISFQTGEKPVGLSYPECARYNAVYSGDVLLHKEGLTDKRILDSCPEAEFLCSEQGFSRCSSMALGPDSFITSDSSIKFVLINAGKDVLFVDNSSISLPGLKHGLFGGCCGLYSDTLYLVGSLSCCTDGKSIAEFASKCGIQVCELCGGNLFDAGGIFFV